MIFKVLIFALVIKFSTQNFIDLGHDLSEDNPIYPLPEIQKYKFKLTVLKNETTPDGYWLAYNSFSSIEHFGSHFDAPYHFNEHGWTTEQIPFERLIAPAVVIDVTEKAAVDKNYLISVADVDNWIAENGIFPNNSVILGRTGWSKKFYNTDEYFGLEGNKTQLQFPGFGVEAVEYIMNFKNTHNIHTVGFGMDTISLDNGASKHFEAHQAVQKQNQYIIENMNNLEDLPTKGATLFVMPIKIRGGTGGPARIFAQLPSTEEVLSTHSPLSDSSPDDASPNISTADVSTIPSSTSSSSTTTPVLVTKEEDQNKTNGSA